MLTVQLRKLEEDGMIHREVFAQVPPKVEYSLTAQGQTTISLIDTLRKWGYDLKEGKLVKDTE